MGILLTHHSEECLEKWGEPCMDWQTGYDRGAEAQLKRVVEWLREEGVVRACLHQEPPTLFFTITLEDWQTLLKETECTG